MPNKIPINEFSDQRAVHDEEVAADRPLAADVAREMMAAESTLYEFLADKAVAGNSDQTVTGHNHGRGEGEGVYVPRQGTFHVGHVYPQETDSDVYQTVYWEILNTGGPSGGTEGAGQRITLDTPSIYIHQDYTELLYRVILKCENGATATARLTLKDGASVLVSDEVTASQGAWTTREFSLAFADSSSFTGWRLLKLELKSSNQGDSVHIAADDILYKPASSPIYNGVGHLIGELP